MGSDIDQKVLKQLNSHIYTAVIKFASENAFEIVHGNDTYYAVKSFSCLVEPIVGDTVMVWAEGDSYYIIEILKRENKETKLTLKVSGSLNISATENINVKSQDLNVAVTNENHLATKFSLNSDSIQLLSNKVHSISDHVITHAKTLIQSLTNSVRNVSELDNQTSASKVTRVKNAYSLDSTQVILTAKKDVKIDAEKIHMG